MNSDTLKGVPKIAAFLEETERRTYYLLEQKILPAGKLGSVWVASKTKLQARLAAITDGAE